MLSSNLLLRACHRCAVCLLQQQSRKTLAVSASEDLPRITVPHKMYTHLQKVKQRQQSRPALKKSVFKSPLVLSCRRQKLNHHRGQTYSDFGPQLLASYGWRNRKSAGDYFTILSHDKNPALLPEETGRHFSEFHLDEDVVRAVEALGYSAPTSVQSSVIPAILQGQSTLCAAETGSGKTLAYLLPAVDMLLRRKNQEEVTESLNTPSIVILVPSRELADQIMGVVESLQQHLDFTAYSVCGGRGTKGRLAWPVQRPMDILISTPGVLNKMLTKNQIRHSGLQQVILDEADTLLDDSFMDILDRIFHKMKVPLLSSGGAETGTTDGYVSGVQFLLVSATVPRDLENNIGNYVPVDSLIKVKTSGLHRLMPHVPQKFVRLLTSQKPEETVKLVKGEKVGPVMLFCNTSSTSFFLKRLLTEHDIEPALINGEMTEKNRRGVFEKFQEGRHDVLVATDIASRGLDTIDVHHVVNYDFPNFVSDYIHRVGRVGRVGSRHSGYVTSFVTHKWDVELLWQIEIAARKSADLHNINANIKRKILGQYSKRHGVSMDL